MGLWIIARLKLRTDQMTTHHPSSRGQFVLVRLDKREKYTIHAKKALLFMGSNCIVYLCYPLSLVHRTFSCLFGRSFGNFKETILERADF